MADQKPRLKIKYEEKIVKKLQKDFGIKNVMAIPNLKKIVINSGVGEAKDDTKFLDAMVADIAIISGQQPVITKSKKAISNFKIREGQGIGVKVTLRKDMMWYFLDRLISIVLPRIKDFRGINTKAFDGNGNYSLGIKEHTVFPEVDNTKVLRIKGLQVVIETTANNDEQALALLKELGMPFKKINK